MTGRHDDGPGGDRFDEIGEATAGVVNGLKDMIRAAREAAADLAHAAEQRLRPDEDEETP